jgi:hypothetical protein
VKKIVILLLIQCTLALCQETGARYLIITYDDYQNALAPLADWKTRKGYRTKIVTLSEIGSNNQNAIKNYITNAYNTWQIKPEYLLLVGNDNQLPFPNILYLGYWVETDNFYADVTGDYHNDMMPGRLWLFDTTDAKTVVAKILNYDKNPDLFDSLWFKKGVTIVNEYEPGQPSSESLYWEDARYVHNFMVNAGYVHIDSLSYLRGDDSVDVINAINDGRSYILYRGIGYGVWEWPFMNIPPELMTNGFKLPVIVSATCGTIDGIGWWWMNAGTPENPKGPVAFLGTTSALFEAAEMRSALARGTFESIFCDSFTTLGKATEAGRLNYVSVFGDELEYYSWNCLGDPEMVLWTTTPRTIDVVHNTVLTVGLCTLSVNVQYNALPVESALVCVMAEKDSTFYHYGRTNNLGNIEFIDSIVFPSDSVLVTVTGRNVKPYYAKIGVHYEGGPYVLLNSFSLSDSAGGNNDAIANPGEDIEIPLWVMNWGDSTGYDVSGTIPIISSDPFYSVYDTIKNFGDIAPLDSAYTSDDGYNIVITPDCPDNHNVRLKLVARDMQSTTWTSYFDFTVRAPVIHFETYSFPGDVKYTPVADTNELVITLENVGSYRADNVTATIFSDDSFFVIIDGTSSFGTIQSDTSATNQYNPFIIATDSRTPLCHPVDMKCEVASGVYCDTLEFVVYVGQKDYLVWDPDLNHSSGMIIKSILDSLDFYGSYTTDFPYDYLSLYRSLFVCTGVMPNNYVITDTSQAGQEIADYLLLLNNKVCIEGGEVWYGDPYYHHGYNFCPLFDIDPVSNNIGLFHEVSGSNNTITHGMFFRYQGEATMLDHIDSTDGSNLIFRNASNDKGCGIAANNQTVGLSFELGGLVDTVLPSTKYVLIDSIMDYFGILPTGTKERQMPHYYSSPYLMVYPTLCRHSVRIYYSIGTGTASIDLKIYDVTGRLVRSFDPEGLRTEGQFDNTTIGLTDHIIWDGTDNRSCKVSEGIYFIYFKTGDYQKTEKVIVIR